MFDALCQILRAQSYEHLQLVKTGDRWQASTRRKGETGYRVHVASTPEKALFGALVSQHSDDDTISRLL